MFMKRIFLPTLLFALSCGSSYGQPLSNKHAPTDASITATVILNTPTTHSFQNAAVSKKKTVHLINKHLTPAQTLALKNAMNLQNSTDIENIASSLPTRIILGMNNVEVLDQGWYGTCVTFAVTGAMDALLKKNNYVSQLCALQLSDYLAKQGYVESQWKGGYADDLLSYFHSFGFVSIDKQKLNSCGGLKDYPLDEVIMGDNTLTLQDYYKMSENFSNNLFWYSLLTVNQHEQWNTKDNKAANKLLKEVKEVLAQTDAKNKYRIVFGTQLPSNFCSVGACAKHHVKNDTWVLTREIINSQNTIYGGHEMVITGYDDNAVAIDNNGVKHTGLLMLRNSWGEEAGDHGDYYMSYDFFKALTDEVFVIGFEEDEDSF